MNDYLTSLLSRHYRVANAYNGAEGVSRVHELKPDLVVSDLMMPVMSGERMVQALRRQPALEDLPIIMLSAKADDQLLVRLLKEGVQDYLTKPFSEPELLAKVARFLAEGKRTAGALARSDERFRRLFNSAPVPLCFVTRDGVLADSNERFSLMFGYRQDEVADLETWWRLAYPDPLYRSWARASWDAAVAKAAATGCDIDPIEYSVTCKDGPVRTVLISGITLGSDLLATFFDVTERKRTEEALRESEASLQQAQRLAKLGNWSWDTASGAHSWSHEIYRIYGRDPGLPPAGVPEVAAYFTADSWERLSQAVQTALTEGISYTCDAEVVRPDAAPCWVVARGHAVRDASGGVVRLYGTIQEITERKLAEEAVRRLNEELEARVLERTARLEAVNKELEAFSYSVSHDLKAPLRGIDGYSQLLEKNYSSGLDDDGRLFIRNVRASAAQMHQLIEDLLHYSRMERRTLQSVSIDLSELVQAVVAERAEELTQGGVSLRLELQPLVVCADRDGLSIVLRNLVENAVKFSRNAQPPTLEIGARAERDQALLWVRDNGIGFDMRFQDRIFEIFQRLQRAEDYPGTGVGLALVRKAMQRMNGRVWATSAPGEGATFFLEIPL